MIIHRRYDRSRIPAWIFCIFDFVHFSNKWYFTFIRFSNCNFVIGRYSLDVLALPGRPGLSVCWTFEKLEPFLVPLRPIVTPWRTRRTSSVFRFLFSNSSWSLKINFFCLAIIRDCFSKTGQGSTYRTGPGPVQNFYQTLGRWRFPWIPETDLIWSFIFILSNF